MKNLCKVLVSRLQFIQSDEAVVIRVESQEHLSALTQLFRLDLQVGDDWADSGLEGSRLREGRQVRTYVQLSVVRKLLLLGWALLEPLKVQQVGHRWSVGRTFLQTGHNHFLCSTWGVCKLRQVGSRVYDIAVDNIFGAANEWRFSSEEDVDNNTGGPYINLIVVLWLATELGRHVEWTA